MVVLYTGYVSFVKTSGVYKIFRRLGSTSDLKWGWGIFIFIFLKNSACDFLGQSWLRPSVWYTIVSPRAMVCHGAILSKVPGGRLSLSWSVVSHNTNICLVISLWLGLPGWTILFLDMILHLVKCVLWPESFHFSVALSISAPIQHALIIQLNLLCTPNPVSFFGGFEGPLLF